MNPESSEKVVQHMILAAQNGSKGTGLTEMEYWAQKVNKEYYSFFLRISIEYMNLNLFRWILTRSINPSEDLKGALELIGTLNKDTNYDLTAFRKMIDTIVEKEKLV
jgi:hypothetical protein